MYVGLNGHSGTSLDDIKTTLAPLFNEIINYIPKPKIKINNNNLQILIANIDYDEYKGKYGIGRIVDGTVNMHEEIVYGKPNANNVYKKGKITDVYLFNNTGKELVSSAFGGDIVSITGIPDISIGDTIMNKQNPVPLPPIKVEEPTVRMKVYVNKSPLAGKDGKHVQSRMIKDRIYKELERNVAMKLIDNAEATDVFELCGRGQLHLNVFIETMRREGFEMMLGPSNVIEKVIDGTKYEPYETLHLIAPSEYSGVIIDALNKKKGQLLSLQNSELSQDNVEMKFSISTRNMNSLRSNLLTVSKGTCVMESFFDEYKPVIGNSNVQREKGSILASEDGQATPYGISLAQEKGKLFITPKTQVYKNMLIGVHSKPDDMMINVCRTKQLTNMRVSGTDGIMQLESPLELNLDIAMEYIQEDELVEVTPLNIRMMKNMDYIKSNKKR